jgi:hypothetical protein
MKSVAIAVALLALSVGSAHAFTYDGHSSYNPDGTAARLTDPDDQLSDGSAKKSKSKSGFTMSFGGANSSANSSSANSPFLPSANPAFNSPFQRRAFGSPFANQN